MVNFKKFPVFPFPLNIHFKFFCNAIFRVGVKALAESPAKTCFLTAYSSIENVKRFHFRKS